MNKIEVHLAKLTDTTRKLERNRNINDVLENFDSGIFPKVEITSPEQFVPLFVATDLVKQFEYSEKLETITDKTEFKQQLKEEWFEFLKANTPASYCLKQDSNWLEQRTMRDLAFGTLLQKSATYNSDWYVKYGLLYYVSWIYNNTIGGKYYQQQEICNPQITKVAWLTLVKAKYLPLVATSVLLKQPLKIDTQGIKTLYDFNETPDVLYYMKQGLTPEIMKEQNFQQSTLEEMLPYLVGKETNKTKEQILQDAIKVSEMEECLI